MSETASDPRATLQYVRDMLGQLKDVAAGDASPFLLHLIDMAKLEATNELQRHGGRISGPKIPRQERDAPV